MILAGPALQAGQGESSTEWGLDQLVGLLAQHRTEDVQFEETTYSELLTEPVKSRGTLRFTPPAKLEKHVLEPHEERYVIDGDRVSFESRRRRIAKQLSLADYPALRAFVEVFRAGLSGDAATLKQFYSASLQGNSRQWTLLLRPKDSSAPTLVESIRLSGEQGMVKIIAIRAPDGDRSVMSLTRGKR